MNSRALIAECIGTFILTLAVYLSLTAGVALATPVVAGLALGCFVYTIGGISGAQVNPAVTIGLFAVRKLSLQQTITYVVAQIIGAFLAGSVGLVIAGKTTGLIAADSGIIVLCEAIGAFLLVFGVSSVVFGKVKDAAAGLTIGSSLLLGILVASGGSFGILNPAVAIGLGVFSASYLLAPILGGIIAAVAYRELSK